jgi:hypothetical protein
MRIIRQRPRGRFLIFCTLVLTTLILEARPVSAQDEMTITGTVVSSTRNTFTVRSGTGPVQLFVFGRNARRPASIPVGAQVRVVSSSGTEPGVRVAREVTVVEQPAASQGAAADAPVVPPELRRIERDIERQVRRYQVGVRGGVALDPELVLLGVQAQVGPFFRSDVFFRPNIEFGIGEVTSMFALNPEFIYRLPLTSPQDRTSTYVGAGLGINLLHQSFEGDDDGRRIDFGDFHSDTALNILGGVRYRSGMFMEVKTSVYSKPSPTLRLIIGYNF